MSKQTDLINVTDAITVSGSNVGIGTSSPNALADLHVADTTDARIWLDATSGNTLELYAGTGVGLFNRSNNFLNFGTDNVERMRIDSSGNVGIGTGSIATNTKLLVRAATNQNFEVESSSGKLRLSALNDARSANVPMQFASNSFEFLTGNVLVGTTTPTLYNVSSGTGLSYRNGIALDIARQNTGRSQPLINLNLTGADGDHLLFYKDGASIGNIGNKSDDIIIYSTATNHSGLRFGEGYIFPVDNTGNTSDGVHDLGLSVGRYKDAYLSGGIYLGGTGSANKLDDYEEGTFTPFMRINNGVEGITYNGRSGSYIKIGNLVTVMIYMHLSSKGTNVGGVSIDGLPFTAGDNLSTTSFNGNCLPTYFANMATNISTLHGWVDDGTTEMYLRHTDGSGNSSTQNTTNGNMNNNTDFRFFITYIAA